MIPQANPGASYRAHQPEIDAAVARALASGWYILGAEGRAFEAEFAAWLGAPHAVGCANGTDALALALRTLGIGAGAAVATVSHTAVATVAAIEMAGAIPVLLDIDPLHYTMDPVELADLLAHPPPGLPPIRAVIPVHLYGQAADLAAIAPLCARYGAALIEDCSQAHGATLDGRRLGTFGRIATFSLYPTKNLGALGDGGILASADAGLAARAASIRQYGWRAHYVSDEVGVNSRLDELQAAILRVKLAHLDAANTARAAIAARYDAALGPRAPRPPPGCGPCLPPVRRPHAGPQPRAGPPPRDRHRHRHPLPRPGPPPARLPRPRRPRPRRLLRDRAGGGRGDEPADVAGVGGGRHRRGGRRPCALMSSAPPGVRPHPALEFS